MMAVTSTLPGADDITRIKLPNGIVILSRPNFNSPSVVISGYLPAGSIFDPEGKLGLAYFTAASLMRGTAKYNFQEIYDSLESVGASLGFGGGIHSVSFSGRCLIDDLDLLLSILDECLCRPIFPNEQVEKLRAQILTGLAIRAQDTGEMASLTLGELLYQGHPYRRPESGYVETIQNIRQDDLAEFHRSTFGPSGMVLSVVGGIDPQDAVEQVSLILGDWHNPEQKLPPALPAVTSLTTSTRRDIEIPGKSQADILLGAPGPARREPYFLTASLGNNILGQFGMYGRIGEVVREQHGLAYYSYSNLSGGSGPGPWFISAGVDPENVEKAIELIQDEIGRFVEHPVTPEELADSKAYFIGRLPLSLESNSSVAGALLSLERYDLGLDYYRGYPDRIRSITAEHILTTARHYLDPQRLGIAVAGTLGGA